MPHMNEPDFHARVRNPKDLFRLATITRRTANAEVNLAVESHLEANRKVLKRGPKLSKP